MSALLLHLLVPEVLLLAALQLGLFLPLQHILGALNLILDGRTHGGILNSALISLDGLRSERTLLQFIQFLHLFDPLILLEAHTLFFGVGL